MDENPSVEACFPPTFGFPTVKKFEVGKIELKLDSSEFSTFVFPTTCKPEIVDCHFQLESDCLIRPRKEFLGFLKILGIFFHSLYFGKDKQRFFLVKFF